MSPEPTTALVVTQSNDREHNELVAFRREDDGSLTSLGTFPTKGAGSGAPHLQSQGSVTMTRDGRHVLVTDAGSGNLAVFAVEAGGTALVQTVPAGSAPRSVAEHDGLVYVLDTGEPSVAGLRWDGDGLEPLAGSRRTLPEGADPAQVGFSPDGRFLVVTARGRDELLTFPVGASGLLGNPAVTPSSGPTPYGFAFTPGGVLVVTEAFGARTGAAAASSYRLDGGGLATASTSIGNGRSEICWAVVTPDGRHAFTTNFADGAVSAWAVGTEGTLELRDAVAGVTEDGRKGLRDEALSADGRFLYALDADARRIYGWSVGEDGRLSPIGSWGELPAAAAGLAAG
jgi:6-phosphogluconolactonase